METEGPLHSQAQRARGQSGRLAQASEKGKDLTGKQKERDPLDASQVQASSKVRSKCFLLKVYDLPESIIRPTQSSRRGSNPKQRPTVHPFGKWIDMRNANMDIQFTRDEDGSSE